MSDNQRMLLAFALSAMVLVIWQAFFVPQPLDPQHRAVNSAEVAALGTVPPDGQGALQSTSEGAIALQQQASKLSAAFVPREEAVDIPIRSAGVTGHLSSQGSTFRSLTLEQYRETIESDSPHVEHLSSGEDGLPYYAQFGWIGATGQAVQLPGATSNWQVRDGAELTPERPVVLTWDGGEGVTVERTITMSYDYMMTLTDRLINRTDAPIEAAPWGLLFRAEPNLDNAIYILHEGPVGYFNDEGHIELDYDDIEHLRPMRHDANQGWLGITDKYWATVLIPQQDQPFTARFLRREGELGAFVQTDYRGSMVRIDPGEQVVTQQRMFSGAKLPSLINEIHANEGIAGFDLVIDWGLLYFLTKPLAATMTYFYDIVGNFGIAIMIVTVLIKLLFFPLAYKSYVAMSRMQKIAPRMNELKEQYGDDTAKIQQEMAKLYREEKVNPAAGCLPILLQIPVFFALYKVIYVSILLRHAPFYGWIVDLSAPDPTSLFNLFGLLPYSVPQFLTVGVWPILMGITMFIQMQLTPQATINELQRKIFLWLPLIFTVMLAPLPSGLIIYWVWNNLLSILQQVVIMRRNGVKVALMDNLRAIRPSKKSSGEGA